MWVWTVVNHWKPGVLLWTVGDRSKGKKYLVVVKGATEEVSLAKEIINRQGSVVEEANRR